MPTHKLQITCTDDGRLTVTHRCTVNVGGHAVSHSEPVELTDPAGAVAVIKGLIDENRKDMEARTTLLAIQHAAALAGRVPPNTKSLKVGGTLGPVGGVTPVRTKAAPPAGE